GRRRCRVNPGPVCHWQCSGFRAWRLRMVPRRPAGRELSMAMTHVQQEVGYTRLAMHHLVQASLVETEAPFRLIGTATANQIVVERLDPIAEAVASKEDFQFPSSALAPAGSRTVGLLHIHPGESCTGASEVDAFFAIRTGLLWAILSLARDAIVVRHYVPGALALLELPRLEISRGRRSTNGYFR